MPLARPSRRMRAPKQKPSWKPLTAIQLRRRQAIGEVWKTQTQIAEEIRGMLGKRSFSRPRVSEIWRGAAGNRDPRLRLAFAKCVARPMAYLGWSDDGTRELTPAELTAAGFAA